MSRSAAHVEPIRRCDGDDTAGLPGATWPAQARAVQVVADAAVTGPTTGPARLASVAARALVELK